MLYRGLLFVTGATAGVVHAVAGRFMTRARHPAPRLVPRPAATAQTRPAPGAGPARG